MSRDMVKKDIKTTGYVLRRTNYGEADRILNLITPLGKMAVVARGARKERSKLAGGIEMLTLSEYNIHQGKSEFGIVTGVKMKRYCGEVVRDFGKMEMAAWMLKKVNIAAEGSDSPDFFRLVDQVLTGLDIGIDRTLVEGWFWLNLVRAMGEEVNLYCDVAGGKLEEMERYEWHNLEMGFVKKMDGRYGTNEIKMLRLMLTNDLAVVKRIKVNDEMLSKVLGVARAVGGV